MGAVASLEMTRPPDPRSRDVRSAAPRVVTTSVPTTAAASSILALQRSAGNAAMTQILGMPRPTGREPIRGNPIQGNPIQGNPIQGNPIQGNPILGDRLPVVQRCGPTPCNCSGEERAEYAAHHPDEQAEADEIPPVQRRVDQARPASAPVQRLARTEPRSADRVSPGSPSSARGSGPRRPASTLSRFVNGIRPDSPGGSGGPGPAQVGPVGDSRVPSDVSAMTATPDTETAGRVEAAGGAAGADAAGGAGAGQPGASQPGSGEHGSRQTGGAQTAGDAADQAVSTQAGQAGASPAVASSAPDVGVAGGFGPDDEARVVQEFQQAGDRAVEEAGSTVQAAPTYDVTQPDAPGPGGTGPTATPARTAASAPAPGHAPTRRL